MFDRRAPTEREKADFRARPEFAREYVADWSERGNPGFRLKPRYATTERGTDKRGRPFTRMTVKNGLCPCAVCDHELMIECDPASDPEGVGCVECSGLCT